MRLMLVLVVTAAAWLGGLGPGLLATALGLVAIVAADDRPADRHALVVRLARFGSLALLIDALFAAVHAQRRRAERREQELVRAERRCGRRSRCSATSTNRRPWRWASSS